MDVEPYISAPLITEDRWTEYMKSLVMFGDADVSPCDEVYAANDGAAEVAVVAVAA